MPETQRPSGVTIRTPDTFRIAEPALPGARRRRPTRISSGPIPIPSAGGTGEDTDALLAAMEQQQMQVVDRLELQPTSEPTGPTGRRRAGTAPVPEWQTIAVDVDLGGTEDAVLLVEQEGMYSWHMPASTEPMAPPPAPAPAAGTRRGVRAGAPGKRASFRIEIRAEHVPGAPGRRNIITDFIYDKVKVYAIKFAARLVVGQTVKYLERNVRTALIQMSGADPTAWRPTTGPQVKLPKDRPARILLFVHGTFSSTIGSFGHLGGTPWGQAFLAAAEAHYDAVLGFDHATLGEDPVENASHLLSELEALKCPMAPQIDAIAFSRGGLVLRSLVEHLLSPSTFQGRIRKAVFVACTNGGTKMADAANWQTLLDLYTNLAVGAFRLLSLLPQAHAPALVLKELVKSLGAFVKYLATSATTEVPGLAAMRPAGEFVKVINQTQPNQPGPAESLYYAVTSDFAPVLTSGDHKPKELPLRLVMALAEGLVTGVMNAPNDLVVDTPSMTTIDPGVGGFIKDTLAFGSTPLVYHTTYFTRPEVVNACTRWLDLPAPALQKEETTGWVSLKRTGAVLRSPRRGGGLRMPAPLPGFRFSTSAAPASVDTDIIVTPASSNTGDVLDMLGEIGPSYVVVSRPYQGKVLSYAFRAEEIAERASWPGARNTDLMVSLNLHETDSSQEQTLGPVQLTQLPPAAPRTARRGVVMSDGRPVGVVPEPEAAMSEPDIVELARAAANPSTGAMPALRRAMPSFAPEAPAAAPLEPVAAPPVNCHFLAEMEAQVQVNHVTTVEVSISREEIAAVVGRVAASAAGAVDPTRKIIVQVIPKVNFVLAAESDRAEVDAPGPGETLPLYFDVKATNLGEGEVWVVIRQRQTAIARLVLRPAVVERRQLIVARTRAEGDAVEAPPLEEPLHQLTIIEQTRGNDTYYFYEVEFPAPVNQFRTFESKPLKCERSKYVAALYKEIEDRWVSNQSDVEAFSAELQALGVGLFEELFPVELQEILWKNRSSFRSIRVVSTEPLIPWELLHLKEPGKPGVPQDSAFLAQMGLVRWLYNVDGFAPTDLVVRDDRARYVIPEYPHPDYDLPETKLERDYLVREFGATAVEPQPNPVRSILSQPGSFDLLHFACHGEAEGDNIVNARVLLEGRVEGGNYIPAFLSATTVESFANLRGSDGKRPIVVLNACQVGRAGYKLTGIGGFSQAFLRCGAGLFVGTLWSVGDAPASSFTKAFYDALKDRKPVAEAAIAAREAARLAKDATWLAYVVYGHPHARLRTK